MSDQVVTEIQLRRAHRLAAAHGHGWSYAVYDDANKMAPHAESSCANALPLSSLVGLPVRQAEELVAEARALQDDDWPGIALTWDSDGDIGHCTGTGRLTWNIDPQGQVVLNVWRPGANRVAGVIECQHVAGVIIDDDNPHTHNLLTSPRCCIRHIVALAAAVDAVTPWGKSYRALTEAALKAVRADVAELAAIAGPDGWEARRLQFFQELEAMLSMLRQMAPEKQ